MNWFKQIFSKGVSGDSWYLARSRAKTISQIVLSVPASSAKETEFATIMLPYDRFPILSSSPWCTGFVRMSNKPVPYQMIRVDAFDEDVKNSDLTIAFSFGKFNAGSIFYIATRIENESIAVPVRQKFPEAPPINKPVAEWIVNVGDSYSMKMIEDVFSSSDFHVIVANSQGASTTTVFPDGEKKYQGPRAHHERQIRLDAKLRHTLTQELRLLISHHNAIPTSKRQYKQAYQELGQVMPVEKDPVFARP